MSQAIDPRAADPAAEATGPSSWIIPAIIGSAMMMLTLESTIMSNAVPTIARALHEDPLRLNLAMTMFLLASAVSLPISGWIADKFGARKILITAMLLFAASSAACGLSQSLLQLVMGRILQGVAAAMMLPVGRLVLLRTTPREELVAALSIFTLPPMVGPLIGPLLGGFIVTYFDWRWIFFINLPVAAVGVSLMRAYVPDVKEEMVGPIDWLGVLLTGTGLAAAVFGFENLGRDILSPWIVAGLFALAVACFAMYRLHARANPHAVIRLDLFRLRTFATATMGGAFVRIGVGGLPFLLAMLLQVGFGMSPLLAGSLTFVSGVGAFFMKSFAPPLLRRFGFRRVMCVNIWLIAGTFCMLSLLRPGTPLWVVALLLGVGGFFRSLQFSAMGALAFADVEPEAMSGASTMLSVSQQVVQSLGIGISASLVHFLQLLRHEPHLTWRSVAPVFATIGGLGLISLIWFTRLPADAGAGLHGRRRR